MSVTWTYYILAQDKQSAKGPYRISELVHLAQIGEIDSKTCVACPGDDDWSAIEEISTLNELLFENAFNGLSSNDKAEEEVDVRNLLKMNADLEGGAQSSEDIAVDHDAIEIKKILKLNREHEDPNTLIPALQSPDALKRKPISRRFRDYFALCLLGNLFLLGALYLLGLNAFTLPSLLGLGILYNAGLAYVMFIAMDAY